MSRRVATTAVGGALVLLLVGCGSGSETIPPTGVDLLEIPTPEPDSADFVEAIDNPWFVLGEATFVGSAVAPLEQVVEGGPEVAGVATTAVTLAGATDYYAQDDDGNVWWFGREGEWEAGVAGAQAGLVMAATPRQGDGYRRALVPGSDLRAEVLDVDGSVRVEDTTYDDAVVLEVTTDLEVDRAYYVRDVGLVLQESTTGEVELQLLAP